MKRMAIVIGYFCMVSTLTWGMESSSDFDFVSFHKSHLQLIKVTSV